MHLSTTQYTLIQSSLSLLNTFIPLVAGILLDSLGARFSSISASLFILVGQYLVYASTIHLSWVYMCLGRLLYGVGSGALMVIQEGLLSLWFNRSGGLALALGLHIACSRLAAYLATVAVYPIIRYSGFFGTPFLIGFYLCFVSFLANIYYLYLAKTHPPFSLDQHESHQEKATGMKNRWLSIHALQYFPHAFWAGMAVTALLGANWTSFLHINTDVIHQRMSHTQQNTNQGMEEAAWMAGWAQLLPVLLAPIIGWMYARIGHRVDFIALSALLFSLSALCLCTGIPTPSLLAMILFSMSLSLGPLALMSSFPMILPQHKIGTAYGVYKSVMNTGITLADLLIGVLVDYTASYDIVMVFYMIIGMVAFVIAMTWMRRGWHGRMMNQTHSALSSAQLWQESMDTEQQGMGWFPVKICAGAMILSWLAFILLFYSSLSLV